MTARHKTKVWSNDGIWGWSCICGESDSGWEEEDNARSWASAHFWDASTRPPGYVGTGGD